MFWICIKYEIIYIVQTPKNQVKYVSIVCIISTILIKLFLLFEQHWYEELVFPLLNAT